MVDPRETGQVEHREPHTRVEHVESPGALPKAPKSTASVKSKHHTARELIESLEELLTSENPEAETARHVLGRAKAEMTSDLSSIDSARITRALRDFDALAKGR